MLRVLEAQLTTLYKEDATTMADHIDKYSQLIEQIDYNLEPSEKWSNGRINRNFFGTLNSDQWGAYEDGLGELINETLPSDLYARIKARDAAKRHNKQRESATINGGKEANFTNKDLKSRVGGRGRGRGKCGNNGGSGGNGGKFNNSHHPYRRLDKEYVKRMKQQWDYIECGHCHYPGHTNDACRQRKAGNDKSNKGGYNQQRNSNGNYQPNFTGSNGGNFFNGGNIANITEYEALSTE
jgi:hypothetical protein